MDGSGTRDPPIRTSRHLLRGLLPLRRGEIPRDILAGITLAALGIPEVMGYAKIAGTPVMTGLYTILLPLLIFALLGGSRHLVVAADSATAAILAGTLSAAATIGSTSYVGLTSLTVLLVGVLLGAARLLRLGFLAEFLSRSALIGFLTGVGIQVAMGELPGLIGIERQGHDPLAQFLSFLRRLGDFHLPTFLVVTAVLATIFLVRRLAPRWPGALLAVIGATAASAAFDFRAKGIAVIGEVPGGLPDFALPPLDWGSLSLVATASASCFVVVLAQSAATSRAFANRHDEAFDEDADLIGLAGANIAASLTGTFVVNGSPTKTELVDEAGGRSQLAHLTTAAIVLVVLLFFTAPLRALPVAVLSAIVFMIGIKLIDLRGLAELYQVQRDEWVVALLTVGAVVFVGVLEGILTAMILSLIAQAHHSYQLRTRLLAPEPHGGFAYLPVATRRQAWPGIFVYRFEADLFYANASRFVTEITGLADTPDTKVIVIDASGIESIDFTAAKALMQLHSLLEKRGIRMVGVALNRHVIEAMNRYREADAGIVFPSVDEALKAQIAALQTPR